MPTSRTARNSTSRKLELMARAVKRKIQTSERVESEISGCCRRTLSGNASRVTDVTAEANLRRRK